jgi:hypothetical protein
MPDLGRRRNELAAGGEEIMLKTAMERHLCQRSKKAQR